MSSKERSRAVGGVRSLMACRIASVSGLRERPQLADSLIESV